MLKFLLISFLLLSGCCEGIDQYKIDECFRSRYNDPGDYKILTIGKFSIEVISNVNVKRVFTNTEMEFTNKIDCFGFKR